MSEHKHDVVFVDAKRWLYYTSIIAVFELFKVWHNQPFSSLVVNVGFAMCVFALPLMIVRPLAYFLFALDITDSIGWFYTKQGVNVQVLQSMDLGWAYNHHFEIIWGILALVVIFAVIVLFPMKPHMVSVPFTVYIWLQIMAVVLMVRIYDNVSKIMDPFAHQKGYHDIKFQAVLQWQNGTQIGQSFGQSQRDKIIAFLRNPISAHISNSSTGKRNLIILEIESLEYGLLGPFTGGKHPTLMPFVSKLVTGGTFFRNVISQPYTTWSVASMFGVQCNLPLLLHHVVAGYQGDFHLSPNLRCLGDFLDLAGYDLHSYLANIFVGKFKTQMRMHKYKCKDVKDHKFKRDWDLFNYLENTVFPELKQSTRPWVLHIANADCHAMPRYFVDSRCAKRQSGPQIFQSFDCVDQVLERFITAFKNSSFFENTEVLLYGDHVLMEGNARKLKFPEQRALVMAFPFHEQRMVTKNTSIYDIAPTLMKLLGVEYEPEFPFGTDLFSDEVGHTPTIDDFQIIYDMFTSEMKWTRNVTCWNGEKGFCTYAKS